MSIVNVDNIFFGIIKCRNKVKDVYKRQPYDYPIVGYGNGQVNTLRIWDAEPIVDFQLESFERGAVSYTHLDYHGSRNRRDSVWQKY